MCKVLEPQEDVQVSKPKEPWWGYVKNVIRRYPYYQKELKRLKESRITPSYSKGGGVGRSCRKTEITALRSLQPRDQERYEAVEKALQKTRRMPDADLRLKFIEWTYFARNRITLEHAAMRLYVSYPTILRWNKDFCYMVAKYLHLT